MPGRCALVIGSAVRYPPDTVNYAHRSSRTRKYRDNPSGTTPPLSIHAVTSAIPGLIMTNRFRTEDEPAKTRADYWQHVIANTLAPYQIRPAGGSLRSHIHQAEIGPVTVLGLQTTAMQASRTPDLIRNSDLGLYKIDLAMGGRGVFEQDDRESVPTPGEFLLMDLSRPSHVAIEPWHGLDRHIPAGAAARAPQRA